MGVCFGSRTIAPPAKAPSNMPVDHPAPILAPMRRSYFRTLSLALGFLVTLGLLLAMRHLFNLSGVLT